jgi:hypothetical protein
MWPRVLTAAVALFVALSTAAPRAEPVTVRYAEGLVHGFLTLKSPDGTLLAIGDLLQKASGTRVTSQLVFHFKDGSTSDETAVFSQRGQFSLISHHLIQKGPAFEQPLEMTIDRPNGHVVVRYTEDGKPKVEDERMKLPPDLANGMIIVLLKNIRRDALPESLSMVAATPKPRMVKLKPSVVGQDAFVVGGTKRTAIHYQLKVDAGGIAGVIAPIIGKQPPDSHVWIMEGDAPAFVKSQAPMFMGGALWQTELTSPEWR